MATIAYVRASKNQTIGIQKQALASAHIIHRWFEDHAVSDSDFMTEREGWKACMAYLQDLDILLVTAIDRLGRNTMEVLATLNSLQAKGVTVIAIRENFDLSAPNGKAMLTILAAAVELEQNNVRARQMAGIARAKAEGKTLGRKKAIDDQAVKKWRQENSASIRQTAMHYGISPSSVARACRT